MKSPFKMIHHRLLAVTGLLILLLYSGYGLYTSLVVFTITAVTTYICYTLNTQLRLDGFFKFLVYFGIGAPKQIETIDEEDYSAQRKHKGLQTFPKPIEKIIQKFIDSILRDFIKSWYLYIGADEEEFIDEVRVSLEYAITEVYLQLEKVNIHEAVVNLIRMFQRHVKVFDDYRNIIQTKYPGIDENDFSDCITELYEAGIIKNIATRSKGSEMDYLKTLLDIILYKFLPKDSFSCEGGRFMLREILAVQLLEPLVKQFTNPHAVNEIIIDILEPSIPLPVVIQMYEDAMNEINMENLEIEENVSDHEEDMSGNETNYESSPEDLKEETLPKFDVPKNPKSDDNKNDKELLRFDNLDRSRTAAPVYGSKSARDHEKAKHRKSKHLMKSNSSSPILRDLDKAKPDSELVDSGRVSKSRLSLNDDNLLSSSDDTASVNKKRVDSWNDCPPSTSDVFRKSSFNEMPRNQDKLSEQLIAKVRMISLPSPVSCLDTCAAPRKQVSQSPSIDGSVTMEFSKKQQSLQEPTEEPTHESLSVTDESNTVKVHNSGADGAFYEVAPTCPTCIEMTILASPFENDKAQLILSPNEKIKIEQHECGLDQEHYYYAETDNESINVECLDDKSFESCADFINDFSESYSSGTLLASGESIESSDTHSNRGIDSYDILSSLSSNNTDNSSIGSFSYDEIGSNSPTQEINPFTARKNKNRTNSVATFRTAIEGSIMSASHKDKEKKLDAKQKKDLTPNQIFKFFKSGFSSIKRRRRTYSNQSNDESNGLGKRYRSRSKTIPQKKKSRKKKKIEESDNKESIRHEASSISTSVTKFNSLPDSSLSPHTHWNQKDAYVGSFIEEVGLEAEEDEQYLEEFKDAPSQMYPPSSLHDVVFPVDPLSYGIAVTEKDLPIDSRSIKSVKSSESGDKTNNKLVTEEGSKFIPIFEGEVIMPHPSKLPAAWLYPIQMISIPTTELAFEKGWEPGINKYTLYSVHYDIRIWPDLYQKQVLDVEQNNEEETKDVIPVIREIKRRYREFLYLHNRLTHCHLSKYMKGILRPNRRYAMPFGRMDPDVIEGRRKILETYLVSLVSRPELCNSREFNYFLGSEGNEDTISIKPKKIAQKKIYKQKVNKLITGAEPNDNYQVHKEHFERFHRGLNSQYFIHGYEIPRMFGFSTSDDLIVLEQAYRLGKKNPNKILLLAESLIRSRLALLVVLGKRGVLMKKTNDSGKSLTRHSMALVSYFVDNYHTLEKKPDSHVVASFEPIQKPRFYIPEDTTELTYASLGPRTDGDGAEAPDDVLKEQNRTVTFDDSAKKHDGQITINEKRHSILIAAKFSEELAAQLQKEKENLALEIAHEKDLYESSWPLTDAVLSIASQALKSYGSWLTFEKVQQAVLFSLGGIIEWLIGRELNEVIMQERCYKYLKDLYYVVWDEQDNLKEKKPEPTNEEKVRVKEEALKRVMEIIPTFVMMSVGPSNYKKCCENLLDTLQYQRVNRHVLYAALEIIILELVPEMQHDFEQYVKAAKLSGNAT